MAELWQLLRHLELAAHAYGSDQTVRVPDLPPRQRTAAAVAAAPSPVQGAPLAVAPSTVPADAPPPPAAPPRPAPTRPTPPAPAPAALPPAAADAPAAAPAASVEAALAALRKEIAACTRCPLHQERQHPVPGEGNPAAAVLFVGEAPGASEDKAGRPFVGPSGQLLDRILNNAMGLQRSDVYIANVAKCHPPGNRNPAPDEVAACLPFLRRQIELVQPKVLVCLGRVAAQSLLGGDESVAKLRGRELSYLGIPVVVTWHPAYLLREPSAKRDTWEDVKRINRLLGRPDVPPPAG